MFLDADDRLLPDAIATGLAALSLHPEWGFVTGHVQLIGEDGAALGVPAAEPRRLADLLRPSELQLHLEPGVVMYRREVLGDAPFRSTAEGSADFELNLRLAHQFRFGCHHRVVLEYRQHGANMSGDARHMLRSAVRVRRAERRHVRASREAPAGLAAGIDIVRADFGARVVEQVKVACRSPRRWPDAVAGLVCLLRYHPGGLAGLFTAALAKVRSVIAPEDRPSGMSRHVCGTTAGRRSRPGLDVETCLAVPPSEHPGASNLRESRRRSHSCRV